MQRLCKVLCCRLLTTTSTMASLPYCVQYFVCLKCTLLHLRQQWPACQTAYNAWVEMLGTFLTQECAASSLAPGSLKWVANFGNKNQLLHQVAMTWQFVLYMRAWQRSDWLLTPEMCPKDRKHIFCLMKLTPVVRTAAYSICQLHWPTCSVFHLLLACLAARVLSKDSAH